MDYRKFYVAVRRYVKRKITREEFCVCWEYAQRRWRGAEPASGQSPRGARTVTA